VIVGSSLVLTRQSSFPGINALWPCAGTALAIWAGSGQQPPHTVLATPPLVFIGRMSYSLYLWHWPLIAFLHYLDIDVGSLGAVGVAGAAILLAWLSWKFLEVPMRRSGASQPFPTILARRLVAPLCLLLIVGAAVSQARGFPQRFDPRVATLEADSAVKPQELRHGCHVPTAQYDTAPSARCRIGDGNAPVEGILIGDSFANHFTGMIDVMAGAEGISVMDFTMDRCPPILGYETRNGPVYAQKCMRRNAAAYRFIAQNHFKRVILAANWPLDARAGDLLSQSLDILLSGGADVTIVLGNEGISGAATCPIRRLMFHRHTRCDAPRQDPPPYFAQIRAHLPQVHFIDPNQVICDASACDPVLDGVLLYRDDVHLNDVGSRMIGDRLLSRGERILARTGSESATTSVGAAAR